MLVGANWVGYQLDDCDYDYEWWNRKDNLLVF